MRDILFYFVCTVFEFIVKIQRGQCSVQLGLNRCMCVWFTSDFVLLNVSDFERVCVSFCFVFVAVVDF